VVCAEFQKITTTKIITIMTIKNTENQSRGSQYLTPQIKSLKIVSEGVLCGSLTQYHLGGGGKYSDEYVNDNGEY